VKPSRQALTRRDQGGSATSLERTRQCVHPGGAALGRTWCRSSRPGCTTAQGEADTRRRVWRRPTRSMVIAFSGPGAAVGERGGVFLSLEKKTPSEQSVVHCGCTTGRPAKRRSGLSSRRRFTFSVAPWHPGPLAVPPCRLP